MERDEPRTPGVEPSPDRLFEQVYEHLRALARQRMAGERDGHTLQPTALVHEAFLKLGPERLRSMGSDREFWGAVAEAMRRILIDHARARGRDKRGGALVRQPLDLGDLAREGDSTRILSLDEAIQRLGEQNPEMAQVVKYRFYAGLGIDETARAMELSPATVKRRWEFARSWLFRELGDT